MSIKQHRIIYKILFIFCSDIDECHLNTDGCSDICTDKVPGFECSCEDGFELAGDQKTCNGKCWHITDSVHVKLFFTDIKECNNNNNGDCSTNCINTYGSYYCTCNAGYHLDTDGLTCVG